MGASHGGAGRGPQGVGGWPRGAEDGRGVPGEAARGARVPRGAEGGLAGMEAAGLCHRVGRKGRGDRGSVPPSREEGEGKERKEGTLTLGL